MTLIVCQLWKATAQFLPGRELLMNCLMVQVAGLNMEGSPTQEAGDSGEAAALDASGVVSPKPNTTPSLCHHNLILKDVTEKPSLDKGLLGAI